jgi:hypothetical protein
MMIETLVNIFLGSLGKIFTWLSKKFADKMRKHGLRKLSALNDSACLDWVISYYTERGLSSDLLIAEDNEDGTSITFPFLTRPLWLPSDHRKYIQLVTTFDRSLKSEVQQDEDFISKNRSLGKRLDDNPTFMLTGINSTGQSLELVFGIGTYLQYFSIHGKVRQETMEQWSKGANAKTPVRDKFASSLDQLVSLENGASATGVTVAVVYPDSETGGNRIILQERSLAVVAHEGVIVPLPQFAFQPTVIGYEQEECDLLHNFYRELCEEYYDQPEILDYQEDLRSFGGRLHPKWFYHYKPISQFEANKSLVDFKIDGLGFDAMNGEPNIAAVAKINTDTFVCNPYVKKSWESKRVSTLDLYDAGLVEIIRSRHTTGLAAIAIISTINLYGNTLRGRFSLRAGVKEPTPGNRADSQANH